VLPDLDGCLLLRCYNVRDQDVVGSWRLGRVVRRAQRVRADGMLLEELPVQEGTAVRFTAAPHGLVSIRVHLEPRG
jgi:hypothetical protein